jgi:hypothetical protein
MDVFARTAAAALCAGALLAPALGGRPGASAEGRAPLLRLVRTIPLEGVEGRIDHLAIDAEGKRLVVAARAAGRVEVVDLEKGAVAGRLEGLAEPQGVLVLPKTGRIVVACGGDGTVRYFDPATLKEVDQVRLGADADDLRLEAGVDRIWVGHGEGGLAVLDKGNRVFDVALEAHPEAFALEANGKRAYVNVPGARQIAVVDREKQDVVATWSLGAIRGNSPLALDEERRRLFVGCRTPARCLVYDVDAGKLVADLDLSGDVDDVYLDPAASRVYFVCGEGHVDVAARGKGDAIERVDRVATRPGARTGLFVAASRTLYVALPSVGGRVAEVRAYEASK